MLLAPNIVEPTVGVGVGACHRDVDVAAADSRGESAHGHLDGGAVVGVGHQPVGQGVRTPVGGAGPGDAEVGEARPARGPGRGPAVRCAGFPGRHASIRATASPELDPHARRQQRRVGSVDVPQHGVGAADQLPSAGGATRIDSAEFAGQADRAGRDRRARLGPPRHAPGAGRRRPDMRNPVRIRRIRPSTGWRCARRPPVRGQSGEVGHLGEIGAVVDDVDHQRLARRGRLGAGASPAACGAAGGWRPGGRARRVRGAPCARPGRCRAHRASRRHAARPTTPKPLRCCRIAAAALGRRSREPSTRVSCRMLAISAGNWSATSG